MILVSVALYKGPGCDLLKPWGFHLVDKEWSLRDTYQKIVGGECTDGSTTSRDLSFLMPDAHDDCWRVQVRIKKLYFLF